jgi:hypothetical protein
MATMVKQVSERLHQTDKNISIHNTSVTILYKRFYDMILRTIPPLFGSSQSESELPLFRLVPVFESSDWCPSPSLRIAWLASALMS